MFLLYLEKLVLLNKKFSKYENNKKEKNENTCSNMSLFYVQSKCVLKFLFILKILPTITKKLLLANINTFKI